MKKKLSVLVHLLGEDVDQDKSCTVAKKLPFTIGNTPFSAVKIHLLGGMAMLAASLILLS